MVTRSLLKNAYFAELKGLSQMPKKATVKKKASSSSSTPETKGGVGETKCIACSGNGISSRGSKCYPCNGSGKRKVTQSFPGGEKKEVQDLSKCKYCSKGSLYNVRTKKFIGCCSDCWIPF